MNRRTLAKIGHAAGDYTAAYLAIVAALFAADGADPWAVTTGELRSWSAAGLLAVIPVAITALRRRDPRYGAGSAAVPQPPPPAGVDIGG